MVELYKSYKGAGLEILGFPCNQFGVPLMGGQESKPPAEIREFVTRKFGVEFPMMEKIDVKGDNTHPVYQLLKGDGADPKWNFGAYFLVSPAKESVFIQRFDVSPDQIEPFIAHACEQL
eukprot:TRINITY_DN8923_c0_g1_i1.p1 TRINITY_DN8923_c0_g1~~TRINITY_DN8923_c0_g1_i1.p1  ORF type:complete len:119 (-),score=33.10 TRINITY_DN8923_c0_g1_i1:315-671(-)